MTNLVAREAGYYEVDLGRMEYDKRQEYCKHKLERKIDNSHIHRYRF